MHIIRFNSTHLNLTKITNLEGVVFNASNKQRINKDNSKVTF